MWQSTQEIEPCVGGHRRSTVYIKGGADDVNTFIMHDNSCQTMELHLEDASHSLVITSTTIYLIRLIVYAHACTLY